MPITHNPDIFLPLTDPVAPKPLVTGAGGNLNVPGVVPTSGAVLTSITHAGSENADSVQVPTQSNPTASPTSSASTGNTEYDNLKSAIENLQLNTIQSSILSSSSALMVNFNLVCSRKYLWNCVRNDPTTIAAIKKAGAEMQLGVGGVGIVTSTLMASGVLTAGITSLVGLATEGVATVAVGIERNNASNQAENDLGSYVDSQKLSYNDLLSTSIYQCAVNDRWHNLNVLENYGALIHLNPPLSANPTANEQYVQACNIWITAAKNIRTFYESFTLTEYEAMKQSASSSSSISPILIGVGLALIIIAAIFFK